MENNQLLRLQSQVTTKQKLVADARRISRKEAKQAASVVIRSQRKGEGRTGPMGSPPRWFICFWGSQMLRDRTGNVLCSLRSKYLQPQSSAHFFVILTTVYDFVLLSQYLNLF